ncbi:MAG TPA: MBL fold metallo-hydrolase [Gemmatimonadales bacterium]|nr:MBL fold metallo-hydrolase [Gemmatimonadales bacterium]
MPPLLLFLTWIVLEVTPQQRAVSTVEKAIAAMGGTQKLLAIKRIQRELVGTLPDPGQGESPEMPDNAPIREVLARDGTGKVADVLDLLIRGGLRLHFRSVSDGQEGFRVNYENNTLITFPSARAAPFVQIVLRRFPEQLLLNAQRRPEALRWLGTQTVNGRKYEVVAYGDLDGEVDDLYFDASTHDLARVQRLNDDPVRGDAPIATLYTRYQRTGGFRFPTRIIGLQGTDTVSDVAVERVAIDSVPDSLFAKPDGLPITAVPDPGPKLVPLGSDVYLVKGGYNAAFVVFDQYVLVLEAPLSSAYQEGVIKLIDSVAPAKPIRYVVSTHFHYDHLGGVRPYIARHANIVTTGAAAEVIRRLSTRPHSLKPDTLSKAPVSPAIQVLRDRRTFSDEHHLVELITLKNMPHVAEIIVGYIPALKLLFQGDLYDSYALAEVPATDDGEALLGWLPQSGLDVEQIIPVHGPNAPVPLGALTRAYELRRRR